MSDHRIDTQRTGPAFAGIVREGWPPILWLTVLVASLLLLMAGSSDKPVLFWTGLALALIGFAAALYLAFAPWPGHPLPRGMVWTMGAGVAFYAIIAAAGAIIDADLGVAALLAGIVPLTALGLILATIRAKTFETEDGVVDAAREDSDDPRPGIGLDRETPLGDTPELPDDLEPGPHDKPRR
jgi:hypothetical protein